MAGGRKKNTGRGGKAKPKPPPNKPTPPPPQPPPPRNNDDNDSDDGPPPPKSSRLDILTLPTPIKSKIDKNEYRVIQLPNGIKCLLISDDKAGPRPSWHHSSGSRLMVSEHSPSISIMEPSSPLFNYGGTPFTSSKRGMFKNLQGPSYQNRSTGSRGIFFTNPGGNSNGILSHSFGNIFKNNCLDHGDEAGGSGDFPGGIHVNDLENPSATSAGNSGAAKGPWEEASFALVVNVGSTNDPRDRFGLAHFLEHMVHYGSKKYPEEGYLDYLLGEVGVTNNAFTQSMSTTYKFTVYKEALDKVLDVFGAAMLEPSFDKGMVTREVNAVDNEFILKKHHDGLTVIQLFAKIAPEGHPLHNFACGTKDTLLNSQNPEYLRKALVDFHKEFYVGSGMTLALQSSLSLDEMEKKIVNHFSAIPKGDKSIRKDFKAPQPLKNPYKDLEEFNKLYIVKAKQSMLRLLVTFSLPPEAWMDYKGKPIQFMETVFSDACQGGLLDRLRKSGLASDVEAHCYSVEAFRNEYCSLFEFEFILNNKSEKDEDDDQAQEVSKSPKKLLDQIHSVLDHLFTFIGEIEDMREPEKRELWNEMVKAARTQFDYSGPGEGPDLTVSGARLLQILPSQDIFAADSASEQDFDSGKLLKYLEMLEPKEMNVVLLVPDLILPQYQAELISGVEEGIEEYSETEYWIRKIPNKWMTNLNGIRKRRSQGFAFETNLFTRGLSSRENVPPNKYGGMRRERSQTLKASCTYHAGQNAEDIYKTIVTVNFLSTAGSGERKLMMFKLMSHVLEKRLGPNLSAMNRAGLEVAVSSWRDSINLKVIGFTDQIQMVLWTFMNSVFNQDARRPLVTRQEFQMSKDVLVNLTSDSFGSGMFLMREAFFEVIVNEAPSYRKQLDLLKSITYEDLLQFYQLFRNSCYAIVNIQGNFSPPMFHSVTNLMEKSNYQFNWNHVRNSLFLQKPEFLNIPAIPKIIRIKSSLRREENSYVLNIYQTGLIEGVDVPAITEFLEQFMPKHAFHILRTQKQLGYVVQFNAFDLLKTPAFLVVIGFPAAKHNLCDIEGEIDQVFRGIWDQHLNKLTEAKFRSMAETWGYNITPSFNLRLIRGWYIYTFLSHLQQNGNPTPTWNPYVGRIAKLSIQVLGEEDETCGSPRCQTRWEKIKGEEGQPISFARGISDDENNEGAQSFISNPALFRINPYN